MSCASTLIRSAAALSALLVWLVACTDGVQVGVQNGVLRPTGDAGACTPTACQDRIYACGDCIDNDGDGLTDLEDPYCVGPCHNAEDTFYGSIPGQHGRVCAMDCYFDSNSGGGDDECLWSHTCDPLSVAPDFPPEGMQCAYDPNAGIAGLAGMVTCDELLVQPPECLNFCLELTPAGCDCFGCCEIVGAPTPVWLGSVDAATGDTCTLEALTDPRVCRPCTQVPSCRKPCGRCERCPGKLEVPRDCEPLGRDR